MGNTVFRRIFEKQPDYRILILGLNGAGKTTMLYMLKIGEVATTTPTIGFEVETVKYKKVEFNVWDVGNKNEVRPLYRSYYQNTRGLIFVIDSNDKERFEEAMTELNHIFDEDELEGIPVLILANKQDRPAAMSPSSILAYIVEKGNLSKHRWSVFGTAATAISDSNQLLEAMGWLSDQVTS